MESANTPVAARDADGFTKSTYRIFDGVARHARGMGAVVLGLLALMVIAAMVMGKKDKLSAEAGNALFLAQKKQDAEMKAMAPPAKPKADDKNAPPVPEVNESEFKAFDVNAKMPGTVKAYRDVIDQFSGTRAAHDARMALAHLYLDHGQGAQAEEILNQAVSSAPRGLERALAMLAQGYARESQGKFKEAIDSFTQALGTGEEAVKADALMATARSYEGLKDLANARSTYDKVIATLPNSEAARNAELYKSQAQ